MDNMSVFTTVQCRISQAFTHLGKKLRPVRKQSVEEGAGALFSVPQILRSNRLRKPLVITDAGAEPWRDRLYSALEENDIPFSVWDKLSESPTADDGENIRLYFLGEGCDSLIALGGGAVLDVTKAAAARAACRGRAIMDMVGDNRLRRRRKIPPVIAIPTVAGTGAESLAAATVADERGNRFTLRDRGLVPPFAVLDPALLEHTPRPEVAEAAMDGLCRGIEAYLSGYGGEDSRSQAARAVDGFLRFAEPCWNDGGTPEQRSGLLEASRLAGAAASQAGSGYIRAMCRGAATVSGLDFACVCAAVTPAVLEAYGAHATEALARLADKAELAPEGTQAEKAAGLIARIRSMAFRMGLPEKLEGIGQETLEEIADLAAAEANPKCSSPVVWTAQRCVKVLQSACAGQ